MDYLIRDCILCPITNVYKKDEKKKDFFFGLLVLLLLSSLEINHCSQNNSHHRFTKLIEGYSVNYK